MTDIPDLSIEELLNLIETSPMQLYKNEAKTEVLRRFKVLEAENQELRKELIDAIRDDFQEIGETLRSLEALPSETQRSHPPAS
ncbi:MAG TPA: hypothetical protein VJI33_02280 [Candidatus Paceibacterota bacterium]